MKRKQELSTLSIVETTDIQHHDVILASAAFVKNHPGNLALCNMIVDKKEEYKNIQSTNKILKNNYVCTIITDIYVMGGRFLTPSQCFWWRVASNDEEGLPYSTMMSMAMAGSSVRHDKRR